MTCTIYILAPMYEAGIPLCPELIHEVQPVGEDLKEILTDLFALPAGFTAVFAFSDMIAWETIYQLNELGKKVPEDISVVGFDGIRSKMPFPCKLTTILTPKTKFDLSKIRSRDPNYNTGSVNCP